jgi:DNA-binding NarL/FixJ family response regulator
MAMQSELEGARPVPLPVDATSLFSWHDVDPVEAWDSLLAGGWVVTEHLVGPFTPTLVARAVEPGSRREALDAGEVWIAKRRAQGSLIKALAFDLGWPPAAVCERVASVMRKLKLTSEVELVTLLHEPQPRELSAIRARSGATDLVVFTYAKPVWTLPPSLTAAERGVVLGMLTGATQREIARARGTAPRTIANQVASIFRKLGVGSRLELFAVLRRR